MWNRRRFLEAAGSMGVLGAIGGGVYLRAASRRSDLTAAMMRDAQQELVPKAHRELQHLPVRARTEIRDWFQGHCLNAAEFAYEVCSPAFGERLSACDGNDARQRCVADMFFARVVSQAEIQERLQVIAQEMGNELDFNWHACCGTLGEKWRIQVAEQGYERSLPDDLSARLDPLVQRSLNEALQTAEGAVPPGLASVTNGLGTTAVLLMPVAIFAPEVALPAFLTRALFNLGEYIVRLLSDRVGDLQAAITSRVALLGRRLGSELEGEARASIATLHRWQEDAIRTFASGYAEQAVPLF